ncbi:thioesterase II family protein [Streptomyces shenzhenensis]|uniref:thioesterase II family protein n=1 Tax=Streptomyces shenzhenensis TaxID=943815 RepID=UPI0015F0A555|nr:alpha/beta fold hydrolase [Streptomyces shenzhenensis]
MSAGTSLAAPVLAGAPPTLPTPWFHRSPVSDPVARLVCFPHAGGVAGAFQHWQRRLPSDVELLAVQYPGRQERLDEPVAESVEQLADQVAEALTPFLDRPLLLFGHSMGSMVAYEVARRVEESAPGVLAHLFVSAQRAPHAGPPGTLHQEPDDALVARVRLLDGPRATVYEIAELRQLVLPSLRADYRLVDHYRPARLRRLHAPITVCGGDRDPGCPVTELPTWQQATTADLTVRVFPGGHFYLEPQAAELVACVSAAVAARVPRDGRPPQGDPEL